MPKRSIARRDFCRGILAGGLSMCLPLAHGEENAAMKSPSHAFDVAGTVPPESVGVDSALLEEVVSFVAKELEAGPCPGAVLAATRYGKTFFEHSWGTYAGTERGGLPCNRDVQFPLYSFTKSITATLAVMARQDGLIGYDDPVAKYIPEFVAEGKSAVTVRHLLTHAAGIPSITLEYVGDEEGWQKAIAGLCKAPLEWAPGSRTRYHAISGMLLMADIVRRVSDNEPWPEICRERLFAPLEADGFTFLPVSSNTNVAVAPPPKSFPHPIDGEHFRLLRHPSGGAFGRTRDILKLLNMNLNGGVWKGRALLQPNALEEMHRIQYREEMDDAIEAGRKPTHEYWGLGWLHRGNAKDSWFGFGDLASPQAFGHAGIDTVIGVADPTRGVALAFITSASPGESAATVRLRNGVTNRIIAAVSA